jgi:hypothetical protein
LAVVAGSGGGVGETGGVTGESLPQPTVDTIKPVNAQATIVARDIIQPRLPCSIPELFMSRPACIHRAPCAAIVELSRSALCLIENGGRKVTSGS